MTYASKVNKSTENCLIKFDTDTLCMCYSYLKINSLLLLLCSFTVTEKIRHTSIENKYIIQVNLLLFTNIMLSCVIKEE